MSITFSGIYFAHKNCADFRKRIMVPFWMIQVLVELVIAIG